MANQALTIEHHPSADAKSPFPSGKRSFSPAISFSSRSMVSRAGTVAKGSGKRRNLLRERLMSRRCSREVISSGRRCR